MKHFCKVTTQNWPFPIAVSPPIYNLVPLFMLMAANKKGSYPKKNVYDQTKYAKTKATKPIVNLESFCKIVARIWKESLILSRFFPAGVLCSFLHRYSCHNCMNVNKELLYIYIFIISCVWQGLVGVLYVCYSQLRKAMQK